MAKPSGDKLRLTLKRRGSLAMTIIVATAVITLAFVSMGSMLFSLSNIGSYGRAKGCQLLAESAIQKAIAQIQIDPNFGIAATDAVDVQLPSLAGSGRICFGAEAGLMRSTNNLNGTADVAADDGTAVPPMSVRLVAKGTCGSESKQIDVLLRVPKYPYVVSSNSPIYSTGGLVVQGVAEDEDLSVGLGSIPAEHLKPGHVFSNSNLAGAGKAISLFGADVSGDVKAVGDAEVFGAGSNVGGQVISQSSLNALPEIPLADFDTSGKNGVVTISAETSGGVTYKGYNRRQGNLTIDGLLQLDKGIVYVDGDLKTKGLSGEGALVVTGKITVTNGGTFTGNQEIAVLAGSDINIEGTAGARAEFRGLLYSKGKIRINEVNLAGILISNDPAGGQLEIQNSVVIYHATASKLKFSLRSVQPGGGMQTFEVTQDPPNLSDTLRDVYVSMGPPEDVSTFDAGTGSWVPGVQELMTPSQLADRDQLFSQLRPSMNQVNTVTASATVGSTVTVNLPAGVDLTFGDEWSLDLNKFIKVAENLRIVSWRVQ